MSPDGVNGTKPQTGDLNRRGERIQELVGRIEDLADPKARELLQECMEAVVAFYGQGLQRILELVKNVTPEDPKVFAALAQDEVVRGFLLIHGLHPVDQQTRLREALAKVRPYLESHGGNVELISLEDDVARLKLIGHCKTCPSSSVTLELAVRQAIEEACPDLVGFEVEGADPAKDASPLAENVQVEWNVIDGASRLSNGEWMHIRAAGVALLICKVDHKFYAYRDRCPACNMPLHLGALAGGSLSCRAGHRYDVPRAGRDLEGTDLHLDPFPLLIEDGAVKVAVAGEPPDAVIAASPPSV